MTEPGDNAVALAAELVGIDSVNPALATGGAGESEIVDYLRTRLEGSGFEVAVVQAATGGRPSLVAVPAGASRRHPTVVLNGHLDTVGVAGMPHPFRARVEGDRLYGRGAADMKAGVAAMVVAAERLVADGAPVRPVLALVADEEDASLGSEAVIAALPSLGVEPDVCLIAEPTDLALARSLRGFAVVEVAFIGRAAHSSQREQGVDAIALLGRFLAAVSARAEEVRSAGGELMVTKVRGGDSPFVVADRAECLVELRTLPGESAAGAADAIRALIPDGAVAEVRLGSHRDAWRLDRSGPAAEVAARLGAKLGTGATFDAPYWMEAPLWQELAPTLICGPSGGGLHAVDEWVDLGQVRRFTRSLIDVLSTGDAQTVSPSS
jgi:acetylornithine deacetylase